jgi:hypothetical protein
MQKGLMKYKFLTNMFGGAPLQSNMFGGAPLEYGIGIENEFCFQYGNIQTMKGSEFKALMAMDKNFDTIKKSLKGMTIERFNTKIDDDDNIRILEVVNLNPIHSHITYAELGSASYAFTTDMKELTKEGLRKYTNGGYTEVTNHSLNNILGNKESPSNLIQMGTIEQSAYIWCMTELATQKYRSPKIDNVLNEIKWKRDYATRVVQHLGTYDSIYLTPFKRYYTDLALITPYNNDPYDFIKMKCFPTAFGDSFNCTEYSFIYAKDYVSSLHFNITLPRENIEIPIDSDDKSVNDHKMVIKYLQIFAPILIAKFGVPDFSDSILRRFELSKGSFRMLHSKTVAINSVDSDKDLPTNQRQTLDPDRIATYSLYNDVTGDLIGSFDYTYLHNIIKSTEPSLGYDFRRSNTKLGFEYRLMDFCGLECIGTIIQFIFLLLKLLHNDEIKTARCKALNNAIINRQIMRVFTSDKTIEPEYRELIRVCTTLSVTQTDLANCFDEIFAQLNDMPIDEKYNDVFTNLRLRV